MISYVSINISDIEMAVVFYGALLATLDYRQHAKFDNIIAYGKENINFIAMLTTNRRNVLVRSQAHIAFIASSVEQVDNFYNIGIASHGKHELEPDFREYPQGEVYTASISDPFGNELEAIYKAETHQLS